MKIFELLERDDGSALLESVAFASVAFGLLLTSSLTLFDAQLKSLELSSIARNAMREYLLDGSKKIEEIVYLRQDQSSLAESRLTVSLSCSAACSTGDTLVLEISEGELKASAFGILNE